MEIRKDGALFCLGGVGYVGLELLWRGYSHGSMFLAGGICFLLLGRLDQAEPRLNLLGRGLVGSGIITMVELGAGLLVNRSHAVWDYRALPGNYLGQICPQYCLLWIPVALGAMAVHRRAQGYLSRLFSPDPLKRRESFGIVYTRNTDRKEDPS